MRGGGRPVKSRVGGAIVSYRGGSAKSTVTCEMSPCQAIRFLVLASSLIVASPAVAQTAVLPTGSRIAGIVYDSLGRRPLAGADVQLQRVRGVDSEKQRDVRTAVADQSGAFTFENVEEGTYVLGFLDLKPFAFESYCRPDLYVDGFLFRRVTWRSMRRSIPPRSRRSKSIPSRRRLPHNSRTTCQGVARSWCGRG